MCVCVPGRSLHTLAVGFLPAPGTVAPKKSQVADDAMKLAMKSLIITSNNLHKIVHVSSSSVHCTHINMIHLVKLYLQVWIKKKGSVSNYALCTVHLQYLLDYVAM